MQDPLLYLLCTEKMWTLFLCLEKSWVSFFLLEYGGRGVKFSFICQFQSIFLDNSRHYNPLKRAPGYMEEACGHWCLWHWGTLSHGVTMKWNLYLQGDGCLLMMPCLKAVVSFSKPKCPKGVRRELVSPHLFSFYKGRQSIVSKTATHNKSSKPVWAAITAQEGTWGAGGKHGCLFSLIPTPWDSDSISLGWSLMPDTLKAQIVPSCSQGLWTKVLSREQIFM